MRDTIKRILMDNVEIQADVLETLGSDDLLTEHGLDSLNIMYVIAEIEQEFGFTFVEDDMLMDNFSTLTRIEKTVKSYLEGE